MKPRLLGPFVYDDGFQLGSRGFGYYASVWVLNLTHRKTFMLGLFHQDGPVPASSISDTVKKVLGDAIRYRHNAALEPSKESK